jgi:hypothetical protein
MSELLRIVWGWTGVAIVGAGLWAIVVGSIKASAQRKAVGR